MVRVGLIVPYFGTLPNYFQLFLNSCKANQMYEWLIFTDDMTAYDYPPNVHRINMTFAQCKELIQSKFDFKISLKKPQKLCDYKCAFGFIFENQIQKYDWWGHCDLDQIFGDLSRFIKEDFYFQYEKICSLGHLTLYKNSYENNRVFMNELDGIQRYKEIFTKDEGCAFDEWISPNINEIYLKSDVPVFLQNIGADINPYKSAFQLVFYDIENRKYCCDKIRNSIFKWEQGRLYQIYIDNKNGVCYKEFPYVHLQKRKMKVLMDIDCKKYCIIPNAFINDNDAPEKVLLKTRLFSFLELQYVKVKYQSLKSRLKNHDWKRKNVFK